MFVANAVMYKVDDMLGEGMSRCSCPFDVIVASNIYPAIPWAAERERERERWGEGEEREVGEREKRESTCCNVHYCSYYSNYYFCACTALNYPHLVAQVGSH